MALLALAVFAAATAKGLFAWILASAPLVWLGEVSYSMYMVHFPVLLVFRRTSERLGYMPSGVAAFATALLLVLLAAALLFYCVERPARRRLRDQFGVLAAA